SSPWLTMRAPTCGFGDGRPARASSSALSIHFSSSVSAPPVCSSVAAGARLSSLIGESVFSTISARRGPRRRRRRARGGGVFPLSRVAIAILGDPLELGAELFDVAEGAIHAREAHVRDVVERAEVVHHLLADGLRADLLFAGVDEIALDAIDDLFEALDADR